MFYVEKLFFVMTLLVIYSEANDCFRKNGQPLNVSCHMNKSQSSSIVWKVTKSRETITLFNCSLSSCTVVTPSDIFLSASVNLDSTNKYIVNSSLTGLLSNVTNNNLVQYSDLMCVGQQETIEICDKIQIYANPNNVTCKTTDVDLDIIEISCWIYPSGRVKNLSIVTNNATSSNESIIDISCSLNNPTNGEPYYSSKCYLLFNLTALGPGDHQISLTASSEDEESDFTLTSNNVKIHLDDNLQQPFCDEPKFDDPFYSSVIIDCLVPLPVNEVDCKLTIITNNTFARTSLVSQPFQDEYVPEKNKLNTFAVECRFEVNVLDLGVGQHKFQVSMSSLNSTQKTVEKHSNWSVVNFHRQTMMNFTVNGSPESTVVKMNENLTLHCKTDGFPPASVILMQVMWAFTMKVNDVDYNLPITSCRQAGLYVCDSVESYFGSEDHISKNVYVNIPCPLQSPSIKPAENGRIYVGAFNGTSSIMIKVFGYPGPTSMSLSKSQNSDKSVITDGVNVVYKEDKGPYGSIGITFKNTDLIKKQTNFTLKVDNGIGNTFFDFTIQANSGMSLYGSVTRMCLLIMFITSRSFIKHLAG